MPNSNPLVDLDMSTFDLGLVETSAAAVSMSMLTLGELETMNDAEQAAYWSAWEAARSGDCSSCDPSGLGESGISEVLCKIWKFVLGIAKAVVDGVAGLLIDLSKAVYSVLKPLFEMVGDLVEDVFSSPGLLMLMGAALVLYLVMSNDKDEGSKPVADYGYREDGRYGYIS